jgi:hypothetical protein
LSPFTSSGADVSAAAIVDINRYGNYIDAGGEILLGYKSAGQSCDDVNWVQTVDTNSLTNEHSSSPFVDTQHDSPNNFYYRPEVSAQIAGMGGYDTQFYDASYRVGASGAQPNVQWSAEVSLVSASQSDPLITFKWGWSTNAAGAVTVQPLQVVSPSPFHVGSIP